MKNPIHIQDLKKYDDLYYNYGTSSLSDADYDFLKDDAKYKYPNHPYFTEVGSKINLKNTKVELPYVLGSLNKVKDEKSLNKWYEPNKFYIATEKLDGVSIYVKYDDNKLIQATTRGNGMVGQDITEKAKLFCPIPKDNKSILEIRGEVLLPGNKYIELGKKNRRNCVAGLMNQKGTENCEFLNVKFYEVINSTKITEKEKNSEKIRLKILGRNFNKENLPKVKIFSPETMSIDSLGNKLKIWKKKCEGIYDIDGIVITKDISERENEYYPKNKIAFKVDESGKTTKVLNCRWQVSRTGRIKPVLEIEPINICGVTIKNVTAHNHKYIFDNKIGKETEIEVVRSGDVIPYITKIHNSSNNTFEIKNCPSCGNQIEILNVDLICNNPHCFAKLVGKISHFFSTLEIEYMSNKTIENLMINLNLKSIEDFYNLEFKDMMGLKGFGDKKITKIISEIKKSLNCKPEILLCAFGIDGIGKENSKNLFDRFSFNELFDVKFESIEDIDGFGKITSENFLKGIQENRRLYDFLQQKGLYFNVNNKKKSISINKIFALTGKGNLGRKEYQTIIEEKGGSVKGINSKTNYLVTNDINSTSGKMKKAKNLGIKILSYEQLEKMLEE